MNNDLKICGGLLCLLLMVAACKPDTAKLLTGKWRAVKFENNLEFLAGKWNAVSLSNPELDNFYINGQKFIDTVGKNNDAATNKRLYGTENMDSARMALQKKFDSAKNMQASGVKSTWFYFGEDGVAILSFQGAIDSSSWYVDSLGFLVLADRNDESKGDKVKMEILALSDTMMQLRFKEAGSYSVVTFHPDGPRKQVPPPMVETNFNFRKDNLAELTFNGEIDSVKWSLEGDSVISISNAAKGQDEEPMQWSILALTKDDLRLRIVENSSVSTLTFKREGK